MASTINSGGKPPRCAVRLQGRSLLNHLVIKGGVGAAMCYPIALDGNGPRWSGPSDLLLHCDDAILGDNPTLPLRTPRLISDSDIIAWPFLSIIAFTCSGISPDFRGNSCAVVAICPAITGCRCSIGELKIRTDPLPGSRAWWQFRTRWRMIITLGSLGVSGGKDV